MERLWLTELGIYVLMGWAFISLTGLGHLWLSGLGICHLMARALWFNGWGSIGKLLFRLEVCSKSAGLRGVPFLVIA